MMVRVDHGTREGANESDPMIVIRLALLSVTNCASHEIHRCINIGGGTAKAIVVAMMMIPMVPEQEEKPSLQQ